MLSSNPEVPPAYIAACLPAFTSLHLRMQFPNAAGDPQAHGASELPTLQDEIGRYALEQKVEHALEELRRKKAAKQ